MQLDTGIFIPMNDFWSSEYASHIDEVKSNDLEEAASQLDKQMYLPDHARSLDHLLYLSSLNSNEKKRSPFTEKEQGKFDRALRIRKGVNEGFILNATVIILTAFFNPISFVVFTQCVQGNQTDCLSQTSATLIPVATLWIGAIMVGFASLYATGISPNRYAVCSDKIQDKMDSLGASYLTLAKFWVDLYFVHAEKATFMAKRFDLHALSKIIKRATYNSRSVWKLVNPLKEAWYFIMNNHLLVTFTEIESYLYNKLISQQNLLLHKRVEELEGLVRGNDIHTPERSKEK